MLGVIGVVTSIKATTEISKTNETGIGLATSGLICSIVGVFIQLLVIILAVVGFISFYSGTNVG
ncbi:hypothetical protein ACJROX_17160 [Pseudalkalibacillus sp. A8]|uniref:hypothetical protein n=1 Tax=Pseudalkalibacillus sp. A8 TaxID=3382641 RepID=UPI0038B46C89